MRHIAAHKYLATTFLCSLPLLATMALARSARAEEAAPATIPTIKVDCSQPNRSITRALTFAHGQPITITVSGTCNENVVVKEPNVTLQTTTGAVITGPDATKPSLTVLDNGVTIDGFAITGGSIGFVANGALRLHLTHCDIENTGQRALQVNQGASAVIDNCTIRNNQFGIAAVTGASFSLTSSVISDNVNTGVQLGFGSSATIGVLVTGIPAGNTITNNGASGIQIVGGSFAAIDNNIITHNGTNLNPAFGQSGIAIFEAGANIGGGNTISDNGVYGIELRDSRAIIGKGNAEPLAGAVDIITGNGGSPAAAGQGAGIFANGSSIEVTGETISNNIGVGLMVALGSTALIEGEVAGAKLTVSGNSGDGIQVLEGGRVLIEQDDLAVSVSGNAGFDLNCLGTKAAVGGTLTGVTKISPTCTGF